MRQAGGDVKKTKEQLFVAEWVNLHESTPATIRDAIKEVVEKHRATLADRFYDAMIHDEEALAFIDSEMVQQKLHASMQQWLVDLFEGGENAAEIFRKQCHVGAVHARIKIPIELVSYGARLIRRNISELLIHSDLERHDLIAAVMYVEEIINVTLDAMTTSYVFDSERYARSDEAYKLFAYGQNLIAEREKQRAALHEWAHQMLIRHLNGAQMELRNNLGMSDFGIWFEHKASVIFEESPEIGRIKRYIEEIDQLFSGMSGPAGDPAARMAAIQEMDHKIGQIDFLLGEMFEQFIQIESGRDTLTHLLNRRFLPSVLAREVHIARQNHTQFSLIMLDIDHFKSINDTWGHAAGDMILQQFAEIISSCVRAGDFVFRFGGEELLIVLVEISPQKTMEVAEHIRRKVEQASMRVAATDTTKVTVSAGIACYDGHPDFERLIRGADAALYQAKESGRNRCIVAQLGQ